MDVIRVYLGVGLFIKGALFLTSPDLLHRYLSIWDSPFFVFWIAHYVALAHLGGGLLMAVGLLTRFAALLQLPVLVGAVFFVHLQEGIGTMGQSLEFSALVLLLVILVLLCGSGEYSVDAYMDKNV